MKRSLNLRQVEAFKAVVEVGTVSGAAELLRISQPAVSKLLAHLEEDTGLELFDRVRGRLIPSDTGMRLYGQVDRIFAGIKQIEHAVDVIRRERSGRISVGVLPAFSGMFVTHATKRFRALHPDAYVSVVGRGSQFIVEWLLSKQLDIGIVNSSLEHPLIESLPLGPEHLVCILPKDHDLATRSEIHARDIEGLPFIGFSEENPIRRKIETALESENVRVRTVLDANLANAVCEMVADGMGVSILDPLFAYGQRDRLAVRRFVPRIRSDLRLFKLRTNESASELADAYICAAQATATDLFASMEQTDVG